ncbi:MAG TPA: carboxypeptidase regulatory-like domain-containing protein [Longimicrobiales bacterium]|nr:carboxypeptidase regulatory-like domain-containing protein [Longimicrobiales bacterium]
MSNRMARVERAFTILTTSAFIACGGGAKTGGDEAAAGGAAAGEKAAPAAPVANAATVSGTIKFTGTPPAGTPIDMSSEPICAQKHPNGVKTEEVVVDGGALENVVVYVSQGLPAQKYAPPAQPAEIDQDGCVYKPHVVVMQVGQKLNIKNADGILHNIKTKPSKNRPFNISQPTKMETARTFDVAEADIPVECNVHNWMHATIAVFDHPYYAVSANGGKYTISNLPPGTYTIETWHEKYGKQTQQVTVGPNETKAVDFTYSGSATASAPVPGAARLAAHVHPGMSHGAGR